MAKKKLTDEQIYLLNSKLGRTPNGIPIEEGLINVYPELLFTPLRSINKGTNLGIQAIKAGGKIDSFLGKNKGITEKMTETVRAPIRKIVDKTGNFVVNRLPEQYRTPVKNAITTAWNMVNQDAVTPLYPALIDPSSYAYGGDLTPEESMINNARASKGLPNVFLDEWNSRRLDTGRFNEQLGEGLIDIQKSNRDNTAIYKSPQGYGVNSYLRAMPAMKTPDMTDEEANRRLINDARNYGRRTKARLESDSNQRGLVGTQVTRGEYSPKGRAIYAPTDDVLTHEQSHASKAIPQENRIQEILGGANNESTDYLDRPTEVYSRLMDFRETNNIDPNQVWDKKALKELKKTGTDVDLLNRYKDEQILDLFNTVADTGNNDYINMAKYGGRLKKKRYFSNGGPVGSLTAGLGTDVNSITNLGYGGASGSVGIQSIGGSGFNLGSIGGGLANSAANLVGGLINTSGNESTAGNVLKGIGSVASNIPGVGGLIGAGVNMVGGLFNAAFGSKLNKEFINQKESEVDTHSNYISGANTNEQLLSDWSSMSSMGDVSKKQVGSDGWFSNKAKKKTRALNAAIDEANAKAISSISNTAGNIDEQNDLMLLSNYSAYGGPLSFNNNEYMRNTFANGGGIHIKEANKGKFTEYCGGKVTSKCIAKGKRSPSPAVNKMAIFAQNSRGWHHALGGYMDETSNLHPNSITNGGDFTNGVTLVNEGGSHEENPLTGVPMGIAPDGAPNLVEEGEVIFNDYVFSNRLHPNKSMLEQFNLPTKYAGKSFADIAEKINKAPSERPNDPISKRGLLAGMSKLMQTQEAIKAKKASRNSGRQFAKGGDMDNVLLDNNPFTWEDYVANQEDNSPIDNTTSSNKKFKLGLNALRYAPALGAGAGVLSDLTGLTNKPNYSDADMIMGAISGLPTVEAKPVGNYLSYNPFDKDYYINKLNADANATRRNVTNTSGGNRATALAGLLASDYNYGQNLGDLARKAEEYNLSQRERVEGFNRQTNMFNSEAAMRADLANQANSKLRLEGTITAAQMRDNIRERAEAAKSTNLANFFESLGGIGQEEFVRNLINEDPSRKYKLDRSGKTSYKNTKNKKKAKGGLLS